VLRRGNPRSNVGKAVNLEKLVNQFRRDLAANPKKAAALGLMVLVALYFWGPLAWKWLSPTGNKRSSKVNMAALILTDDPVDPSQQSKVRGGAKFRWEKARQLIRHDPRMISAAFDPSWTDPFGQPATTANENSATEAAETEAGAAATAAAEPGSLGIVLGSVMIGPRTRVATINGEACHEGDTVTVADKQDKSKTYRFSVVRIHRQSVELDIGGRKFTLEQAQPKLAHGDEFERGKPRNGN
jgi:hypothetical protein